MDSIKTGEKLLLLWNENETTSDDCTRVSQKLSDTVGSTNFELGSGSGTSKLEASKYDTVVLAKVLKSPLNAVENIVLLADVSRILKSSGRLVVIQPSSDDLESTLVLSGFANISEPVPQAAIADCIEVTCTKPSFEIGSSKKLELKEDAKAVWEAAQKGGVTLEDTIDPDLLIDEEDLKKPDAASLLVCGTTGKRKACKDCSCGLDKVLAAENAGDETPKPQDQPKSSCGSCYLGDAFRCASCPYLGMPAFKPGEKVTLNASMLQDDI
ncbi:anamorsin homolog [Neocloeon triangulifer]|uniref:anamorsin homolog n=1 Tax=Neocloeon triangulifer TaxID=2078957 RepID=UPI00286EC144|nr:anamorsin homolog [Neocloeon triangulifer]